MPLKYDRYHVSDNKNEIFTWHSADIFSFETFPISKTLRFPSMNMNINYELYVNIYYLHKPTQNCVLTIPNRIKLKLVFCKT